MATVSLYLNPNLLFPFLYAQSNYNADVFSKIIRRSSGRDVVVFSTHSNPRILKPNRRTRYGQQISPYDDDDRDDGNEDDDDVDDDKFLSLEDESAEMEELSSDIRPNQKLLRIMSESGEQGTQKQPGMGLHMEWPVRTGRSLSAYNSLGAKYGKNSPDKRDLQDVSAATNRSKEAGYEIVDGKVKNGSCTKDRFCRLWEDLDFDEKWFPLIDYLSSFGLKESHFIQMYERHMPCLQINVASAQERLEFLLSVGVKHRDIRKILLRQPQILEYTVESNLKSHVSFLASLGIPDSRIPHVITAAPSLFSYSVEHSLKPTIRYLVEEVGIERNDVTKVIQLSPQILVQRIDNSWTTRFSFLSKELGAPRDSIVKMVTKHPQLLHYSIEDGILPRINFLRSIGMSNSDVLKVLTGLTQVLSLSLEGNLKPKYLYLVNELRNEVHSLTKYPMYLSLSLEQRIRPRHRFLVSLKKAPKGPFPLSSLVPTDECFCQQWAGTSLEKYQAFRQTLLLSDFANKYGRKR